MTRRIEVREEKKDRYWVVRVDPAFDPDDRKRGFQPRVTAYSDMDYSFEDQDYHWKKAEVGCSSMSGADSNETEAYSKALAIAADGARRMDAEHKIFFVAAIPELVITIEICKWCNSPRPIGVTGAEKLLPGKHDVKMQLSHGMCVPCGTKFSEGIGKGGVTQNDTVKEQNAVEEKG